MHEWFIASIRQEGQESILHRSDMLPNLTTAHEPATDLCYGTSWMVTLSGSQHHKLTFPRHFIPSAAFERSPEPLLVNPTPLLEEERNIGG